MAKSGPDPEEQAPLITRETLIRVWLAAAVLAASWLGMMFVHELGHLLHAWVSGGRVERVVLHPLRFSRTDVWPNPHPQFVAWGGVVWGTLLPLLMWLAARAARRQWAYLPRFFAGFCCIANGSYIGVGWAVVAGDAADIRNLGTPVPLMVAVGLAAVAGGLLLWHGLARDFSRGAKRDVIATTTLLALLILVGLLLT